MAVRGVCSLLVISFIATVIVHRRTINYIITIKYCTVETNSTLTVQHRHFVLPRTASRSHQATYELAEEGIIEQQSLRHSCLALARQS